MSLFDRTVSFFRTVHRLCVFPLSPGRDVQYFFHCTLSDTWLLSLPFSTDVVENNKPGEHGTAI